MQTKERQIVECVPNFSEGRDMSIVKQITDEIESVDGISLLDVDPGEATNRTVVTFVGEPEAVVEAAFRAVKKAGQLIDMRQHHGAHPRMGATDVLPLIPVAASPSRSVPPWPASWPSASPTRPASPAMPTRQQPFHPKGRTWPSAARASMRPWPRSSPHRASSPTSAPAPLTTSRWLAQAAPLWVPATSSSPSTSTSTPPPPAAPTPSPSTCARRAVPKREGNPITGKPMKDENGKPIMIPGTLKGTKAIGWYIDEYGIAQVSMNITNINVTPLHVCFDEVCRCAQNRGIRVTGTEIVGLMPKRTLIDAGKYFLEKQHRSTGIPEEDILKIAIKSMGLDDLKPFNPREKVIEYLLEDAQNEGVNKLVDLTVKGFAHETSRESPAPGGGTISAYMGALGAALGTMVANLSSHKPGWDDRWQEFSDWADKGQELMAELLHLVDEDTEAFNRIMAAFGMPKKTDEEKAARTAGHPGGHALCHTGAPAHHEGLVCRLRHLSRHGRGRQSQQRQRCRCRCTGCPCRRIGCRSQREDQRRSAEGPREGRQAHRRGQRASSRRPTAEKQRSWISLKQIVN